MKVFTKKTNVIFSNLNNYSTFAARI